jgi:hypothetical protein
MGLAPHQYRLAHGRLFEMLQIGRQMPGEPVVPANDTIGIHGDNYCYPGGHD